MYKLENNKQWTDKIKKAFKKGITRAYLISEDVEINTENYLMSVDFSDEKADPQDGRFIGKAICRSIDIKLNNKANALNLENKEVEYYLGAEVDGEFVYIKYGKFIVQKPENQEVNEETTFAALDYMSKFDIKYIPTITYPAKIIDIVQDICNQCGVELGNTNFRNADKVIEANPFTNAEQCREVIKSIAKVSFSSAYIWQDDKLYFGFDVINDSVTEELTINDYFETEKNNQIKPITVITLRSGEVAASGQSIRDENLIKQYGENELIVEEDYFTFTDTLRQSFLQEANVLFGLTYYPINIDLEGSVYLSFNDVIKITNLNNEVIKTYCLNNTHSYNGVLYNTISVPALTETEEKYEYKDEDKTKRTKTAIEIDKANAKITEIVKDVSGHETRIAKTETDINGIKNTVSKTTEIVDELSKDVQVYSVDLDTYSIVIPTDGKQYPFEDKSYRVNFYTYFKGKQVNSIVTTASSNEGITCDINSYINLSVKKETKISNLTNEFIINFIYEDEDKNPYTVSKKITVTLSASEIPKSFLSAIVDKSAKLEECGDNKLKALNKLEGRDVEQETREGYNLCNASYTADNKYTFTASKDDDNRILGYYATLEAGVEYKVSFESDGAYGTEHGEDTVQIFLLKDKQYDNYFTIKSKDYIFTPTVSGDYYIRVDINKNGVTHSFWNFFVRKSTETREFELYGASPTPNFPSEVKTVTGNVEVKVGNKNLAKIGNTERIQQNEDSLELISFKAGMTLTDILLPAGNYTISLLLMGKPTTATTFGSTIDGVDTRDYYFLGIHNFELNKVYTVKISLTKPTQVKYLIYGNSNSDLFKFQFQIEKGDVATEYVPHQGQVFPLSLGSLELCKIGDYADYIYRNGSKWFKREKIRKMTLKGTETNWRLTTNDGNVIITNFNQFRLSGLITPISNIWGNANAQYCSHFEVNNINGYDNYCFTVTGNSELGINFNVNTVEELKSWLAEQNTNGTPVTVYYVLATPTDTEMTDTTLIAQLNALENAQLYEGITNIIITGDNLTPIADIDYWTWYKGNEGASGKDGTSTYFYVRYSDNSNGNPMTIFPSSTTQYMGVASTTSSTAPTSYSAYTWSKIKGEQGTSGTPGTAGKDGKTTYLHIKYSEDGINFTPADDDFALGEKPSAYIGQYTDFTEADSSNFADYTWYKFTQNIDAELNQMQSQISQNTTDIENKYQDVIGKMDNFVTEDNLVAIEQRVETIEKDNSYNINIIKDIQVNGVSKVKTETGYMFDEDGLKIEKTGAKVKSKLDEAGIEIKDATGSSDESLLYAGYDEDLGETIVKSKNMTVEKYLVVGKYFRMEDFTDSDGNLGTGMFWIGG